MHPITEHRYNVVRYAVLCALFAAVWAAVFGMAAGMPAGYAALDGSVLWLVCGFEGLILWNVLKYGAEGIAKPLLKTAFHLVVGVLFVGVAVGAECAAMSATPPELFRPFVTTLPARTLCLAVVYALFVLWYSRAGEPDDAEPLPSPAPAPSATKPIERITVRGGQKIKVIGVDEIVYLQAEGDYVAVVTSDGRWLKEGTMKYFEEHLPSARFVRVHRSCIVSVSHISRIEQSGRDRSVVVRDGTPRGSLIRISDAGYKLLRRTLGL